jgi:hypothetical protein
VKRVATICTVIFGIPLFAARICIREENVSAFQGRALNQAWLFEFKSITALESHKISHPKGLLFRKHMKYEGATILFVTIIKSQAGMKRKWEFITVNEAKHTMCTK